MSLRDARLRFGGALIDNKSYDRHCNPPGDRTRQSFDEEDLGQRGLVQTSAGCHDRECHRLQETTAERAGEQIRPKCVPPTPNRY